MSYICLESFSAWFLIFKVEPKKRPFLTILPSYNLCKMEIFATFQNRVIFCIFDVFSSCFFFSIWHIIISIWFSILKVEPKKGPFLTILLYYVWPLQNGHFATFQNRVIFCIFDVFSSCFFLIRHIIISVWFSILKVEPKQGPFLTILLYYGLCKMAIFATFQNRVTFRLLDVFLSRFSHETSFIIV